MDANEYLSSIKQQDMQAFRQLVTEYGKGLYIKLYAASGDADIAKKATKAAFNDLYMAINSNPGPDIIESLLFSMGEKKQNELLRERTEKMTDKYIAELALPNEETEIKAEAAIPIQPECEPEAVVDSDIPVAVETKQATKKKAVFWQVVLVLMIAAVLWSAAGFLMKNGNLPVYDLGYSWFDNNIAAWFMLN